MNKPKMVLIQWLPTNTTEGYDIASQSNLIYDYLFLDHYTKNNSDREVLLFEKETDYVLWKIQVGKYENDVFRILNQ